MNILFWKKNKKHDEFARSLAEEFIHKFPNDASHSVPNKKNKIKLNKALGNIHLKARNYSEQEKPGFYARARIGNIFMWQLKEQEYNNEFIDDLTNDLLRILGDSKDKEQK